MGDGEAETGPLAASWHSNKFLNPARDGAVLPVLHLNGYKIANPTILGRLEDADEEVPLLDKEQLRRERRTRAREFHRGIYKEMRARKRDRERWEGR